MSYNFQFLKAQHAPSAPQHSTSSSMSIRQQPVQESLQNQKSDLEKQFDILTFLQTQRFAVSSNNQLGEPGFFSVQEILLKTGIDLNEEESLLEIIESNARIRREERLVNGDMTAYYGYQAKFNVSHKKGLLALINRCKNGVSRKELRDCYPEVEQDLKEMIRSGEVIAIFNPEEKSHTLFPRGETFIVEMEGGVEVVKVQQPNTQQPVTFMSPIMNHRPLTANNNLYTKYYVQSKTNLQNEIRRGEAIWIGGQWFRVSSAVLDGVPPEDQPARAQPPSSVVSIRDLTKKNEYIRDFSDKNVPFDVPMADVTVDNLLKGKTARESLKKKPGGGNSKILRKRPHNHHNTVGGSSQHEENPDVLYSKPRRHGVSKDIREMYLATRDLVPDNEEELFQLLLKNKLIDTTQYKGQQLSRARMKSDEDKKPKKRRYYIRKGQKITNTHLQGTEIGAALALAKERQAQGKDVGDGGM